jgi:tetraacyldisaccharide 4'-kinase
MLDGYFYKLIASRSRLIQGFLYALSLVYFLLWKLDCLLHGKSYKASIPVVSIGNITVGGTGKTPLTILLLETLSQKHKVAILSRGYKRKKAQEQVVVVAKGEGPIVSSSEAGDEPYLIANQVAKSFVFVHNDRRKALQKACEYNIDIALLDDGMQHRKVYRDEEFVVIGGRYPLGKEKLLPAGTLREPLKGLGRATAVFVNKHILHKELLTKLRKYITCPIVMTEYELPSVYDWRSGELASIENLKVAAFCGIGNAEGFFADLELLGADVLKKQALPDHGKFSTQELENFSSYAKRLGAQVVICTEKDRVKYSSKQKSVLPLYWVRKKIRVAEESKEVYQAIIDRISG